MQEIYQPEEDSYLFSSILKKIIPKILQNKKDMTFLEVGCGSGILIKAAFESGILLKNVFACDINPGAVRKCRKLGFNCVKSDLFSEINGKYDLIVFNPPYLPEDSKEPKNSRIATTGGKKGGEIINKFFLQAKKHLKNGGEIFLLTSSLTKGINFKGYSRKIIARKKLFFEEIYILRVIPIKNYHLIHISLLA